MTAYVAIADSEIDPESPYTTTLATKMRDNPIAITEGAIGAPTIDPINAMNHGGAVGAIGTYALLYNTLATTINAGSTLAGSNLAYANCDSTSSGTPSGTWRCMGYVTSGTTARLTTVWLRIS